MLATENIILKNKFVAYVSDLEQSLFTHTLPSLAWQPSPQAPPLEVLAHQRTAHARRLQVPLPPPRKPPN
jgi:hypothetical protein